MNFDRALVAAAFELAGERGWSRVSVAAAARHGGLKLAEARARFPSRNAILFQFGRIADVDALAGTGEASAAGSERDRLFDVVMRRIDVLQTHRAGVLALFRALPADPFLALRLADATRRSMAWLLEAAGIEATGLRGVLRSEGMVAVWLWTVRAWQRDDSEELSATMAALDQALNRAEQAEASMPRFNRPWDPMHSVRDEDMAGVVLDDDLSDIATDVDPADLDAADRDAAGLDATGLSAAEAAAADLDATDGGATIGGATGAAVSAYAADIAAESSPLPPPAPPVPVPPVQGTVPPPPPPPAPPPASPPV